MYSEQQYTFYRTRCWASLFAISVLRFGSRQERRMTDCRGFSLAASYLGLHEGGFGLALVPLQSKRSAKPNCVLPSVVASKRRKLLSSSLRSQNGGQYHVPLQLLNGYNTTMGRLCEALRSCGSGADVLFSVFVFEPGATSDLLVRELTSAAERGAKITLRTDTSFFSSWTRFCEGTTTLIHRLVELSAAMPDQVALEYPEIPTHVKLFAVRGSSIGDMAIFGGINVGDRFQSWRDFSLQISGQQGVSALFTSLGWHHPVQDPESSTELQQLKFVTNRPTTWDWFAWIFGHSFAGKFDLAPNLANFFANTNMLAYRVAASYIDDSGAELLSLALARGATVEIVLPQVPNVYKECNMRTLALLLARWGEGGLLAVRLHKDMVHAKVAVAQGADAPASRVGFIGSCNLRRRSLIQFEELNALTVDQAFCNSLWQEVGVLLDEAHVVQSHRDLTFSPMLAALEDWLG
mmetsp:Transcript_112835/g.224488  ORF Transcript_112835/g.224488 Transcript_112835/m.224488 type:complete len:464 (-) Transcript_112835:158-1549(-)